MGQRGVLALAIGLLLLLACAPSGGANGNAGAAQPGAASATGPPRAATGGTAATAAPAAASAAAPGPLRKMTLPLSAISGSMTPLWVGVDYGIFARHGLDVEPVASSPTQASQTLASGGADLAVVGGSAVSAWVGGATDLVFVGGLANKAVFKVLGRPEVARMDDLRGLAVGSTSPGSGATLALFETLRRFSIEPTRDVSLVYLREQPNVLAGLLTAGVQGGVLASPFAEQGQAQGLRVLADMTELNIASLANNIATTRGFLAREPDVVHRFLLAYVESIEHARNQPDDAIASILKGTRSSDRADAQVAYDLYRTVWDPWPSEPAIETVLENMDPPAQGVRPAEMIDYGPLRELERSGALPAHWRRP